MGKGVDSKAKFFCHFHQHIDQGQMCAKSLICVKLKKMQFRAEAVNIDVTTLQRETYFLKQLLDI